MKNLLIIGAGGHGRVVAEAALSEDRWDNIAFLDDNYVGQTVCDFSVIGKVDEYSRFKDDFQAAITALGNNEIRVVMNQKCKEAGYEIPVIVHERAYVSGFSTLGEGTVVLAGAVINTSSIVGQGVIININSTVDHDCLIEEGVHLSSGTVIRSNVRIGKMSKIGARAVVSCGINISDYSCVEDGEVIR